MKRLAKMMAAAVMIVLALVSMWGHAHSDGSEYDLNANAAINTLPTNGDCLTDCTYLAVLAGHYVVVEVGDEFGAAIHMAFDARENGSFGRASRAWAKADDYAENTLPVLDEWFSSALGLGSCTNHCTGIVTIGDMKASYILNEHEGLSMQAVDIEPRGGPPIGNCPGTQHSHPWTRIDCNCQTIGFDEKDGRTLYKERSAWKQEYHDACDKFMFAEYKTQTSITYNCCS